LLGRGGGEKTVGAGVPEVGALSIHAHIRRNQAKSGETDKQANETQV
jgi:hypothetical protein